MKIAITGGTGFIGRPLVEELVRQGHEVVVASRNFEQLNTESVRFVHLNIGKDDKEFLDVVSGFDALIHLAWTDLEDYESDSHINSTLPDHIQFLNTCIDIGIRKFVIAGTCQEYGIQEGAVSEETLAQPQTKYATAKDSLRLFLSQKIEEMPNLKVSWIRIFYVFGPGQSKRSLIGQLSNAIDSGKSHFSMSEGSQLRDFIHVFDVARILSLAVLDEEAPPIINACSQAPQSVYNFVTEQIANFSSQIKLERGALNRPRYEPANFWGVSDYLSKKNFKYKFRSRL
jgi:dTDP-6-deoxy-L-talose 4-dehydrogenase (NAD+)